MKKKFLLITIFALLVSLTFTEEYKCFESHKITSSGRQTVHYKIYCPTLMPDDTAESFLDFRVMSILNNAMPINSYTGYLNDYTSEIILSDGSSYRIRFAFNESSFYKTGSILVFKGNMMKPNEIPEKIYSNSSNYRDFNSMFEEYQNLCSKYLNLYN